MQQSGNEVAWSVTSQAVDGLTESMAIVEFTFTQAGTFKIEMRPEWIHSYSGIYALTASVATSFREDFNVFTALRRNTVVVNGNVSEHEDHDPLATIDISGPGSRILVLRAQLTGGQGNDGNGSAAAQGRVVTFTFTPSE